MISFSKRTLLMILLLLLLPSVSSASSANEPIVLDFFYAESCSECIPYKELIIDEFQNNPSYQNILSVRLKNVDTEQYFIEHRDDHDFYPYPFIVVYSPYQQSRRIGQFEITTSLLSKIIEEFRFNLDIIPVINSSELLIADLYYDESCTDCNDFIVSFTSLAYNFSENFSFHQKNIANETFYIEYQDLIKQNVSEYSPLLVFRTNESIITIVSEENISKSATFLSRALQEFVLNIDPDPIDDNIINTPFGAIDITAWSLPLLTIILGGIDSFNPCAFFILIFLLNLLIYAKSRKRMLLIGGIFIFFSGFMYMIFMFFMYEIFRVLQTNPVTLLLVTLAVGAIVLPMGILNIKDFFFFKKGASLSIPDSKKPKIYKKMRNLVKNQKLSATILGTIVLAATVNFYELLCTLGLPFAFTNALATFGATEESVSYYFYIIMYNVVYVIPLFIIVLMFVLTLGKRKLTEWHGQVMKLVSGIMLTMFGIIFLVDYRLLENIMTPILLLFISIGATAVIAFLYKKYSRFSSEDDEIS
jgi:hypothetical protein